MLLVLAATAACQGESTLFVPLPPPPDGARSLIAALKTETTLFVAAIELDASPVVKLPVEELGRAELFVLYYAEPLAELGVAPGEVPRAAEGETGYALYPPAEIYAAEYLGGHAGPWDRSPELDPTLAEFRVRGEPPSKSGCVTFEERRYSLPTLLDPTYAIALTSTLAIVGYERGGRFLAGVDGATMLPAADLPHRSGVKIAEDDFVLAGLDGKIARGDVLHPESFVNLPSAPDGRLDWLALASVSPLSLYAITFEGHFYHFDGTRWDLLFEGPGPSDWRRGIATTASGDALAVGVSASALRARGSTVSEERVEESAVLMAVAEVPKIGELAGAIDGQILRQEDNVWSVLGDSPLALPIVQIAPYGSGFIAAGGGGYLVQYDPAGGYCTEVHTGHPIIKRIAVLEDSQAIIVAGDRASGSTGDSFISVLVPVR